MYASWRNDTQGLSVLVMKSGDEFNHGMSTSRSLGINLLVSVYMISR